MYDVPVVRTVVVVVVLFFSLAHCHMLLHVHSHQPQPVPNRSALHGQISLLHLFAMHISSRGLWPLRALVSSLKLDAPDDVDGQKDEHKKKIPGET